MSSNGVIEFTNVRYISRVGRVTYAHNVQLWNSDNKKLSDFTTHFSFTIDTLGNEKYAAGFAFFLAPVGFQIPPNSAGGFLGLFNTTNKISSKNQIVLVEFDSFPNGWDPTYEHVGININTIASNLSTRWNASLHSRDPADVWITYNGTTKNLTVFWTYQNTSNTRENTSLSYQIDLMEVLPEWVTIGFSAATSFNLEQHTLRSWGFNSSLDYAKENNRKNGTKMIIRVLAVVFGAMILSMLIITSGTLWRLKQMRKETTLHRINVASISDDFERGAGPRRFSYTDLVSATENFSKERKLGEGGFGEVYGGYLTCSKVAVAVKKFSRGSKQGIKEYITEVKIISQLRHRNLVQLIGWCHDNGEFLLVYEFMPNGSLDSHLFGKKSHLSWGVRHKIALGLASGLLYLHEEWEQCVVHRDIKSSNIMLDSGFNVKLGDFGLARLVDHELGPQTTGLAGTLGYLAPECIITGKSSKESDVFSFGVVVLEIATGRKSVDPIDKSSSETGLVAWIWDLFGRGKLLWGVDEMLDIDVHVKQVECLMIVGLWCAHPDRSLRPSIRQAIQVLNSQAPLPKLPKKMPVATYHVPGESFISPNPFITESNLEVGR